MRLEAPSERMEQREPMEAEKKHVQRNIYRNRRCRCRDEERSGRSMKENRSRCEEKVGNTDRHV